MQSEVDSGFFCKLQPFLLNLGNTKMIKAKATEPLLFCAMTVVWSTGNVNMEYEQLTFLLCHGLVVSKQVSAEQLALSKWFSLKALCVFTFHLRHIRSTFYDVYFVATLDC